MLLFCIVPFWPSLKQSWCSQDDYATKFSVVQGTLGIAHIPDIFHLIRNTTFSLFSREIYLTNSLVALNAIYPVPYCNHKHLSWKEMRAYISFSLSHKLPALFPILHQLWQVGAPQPHSPTIWNTRLSPSRCIVWDFWGLFGFPVGSW